MARYSHGLRRVGQLDVKIISIEEYEDLMNRANNKRGDKAAATRRVRHWLEKLYSIPDLRESEPQ